MNYKGYVIERGAYLNTIDDNIDRLYISPIDSNIVDRRGRGFPSIRAAKEEIDRLVQYDRICNS